jgi:hypothetical protein
MSDSYELIRCAIAEKKQVVAIYGGYEREMCPHAIGIKNGRAQAIFLQFAGGSRKGVPPEGAWRCLAIEALSNVSVRDGAWHTASNHSQPNTCIDEVDLEVDY